jgi:hypothetical protein
MVLGRDRGERFKEWPRKQLRRDKREGGFGCRIEIAVEQQSCAQNGSSGEYARGG